MSKWQFILQTTTEWHLGWRDTLPFLGSLSKLKTPYSGNHKALSLQCKVWTSLSGYLFPGQNPYHRKLGLGNTSIRKRSGRKESKLKAEHVKAWLVSFLVIFPKTRNIHESEQVYFCKFRKESVTCWALPCSCLSHAAAVAEQLSPAWLGSPAPPLNARWFWDLVHMPQGLHLLNESNNTLSYRAVSRVILVQKCASSNPWHTARVNKQYL